MNGTQAAPGPKRSAITVTTDAPRLSTDSRRDALAAMASAPELDILVVGGGVTGAGAALDAATRGLRTGLVEAQDFASGTSSRSSKLIHGGLRYLEMLDFSLVKEALRERGLLLQRLAPHLVRPVPFVYPLKHRIWERPYIGAGLLMYDLMAAGGMASRGMPMHRHMTRTQALKLVPALREDALVGAIKYYDAQVDDARHTMMIVRTAAQFGALCASRTQMENVLRDGDRVIGARLRDVETGEQFDVRARRIINATGVWSDETQEMAEARPAVRVRASKGVHLVVPRDRISSRSGLILRTERSVLFVIPWGTHWIIGTTDTDWNLDKAHPAASSADIDYLLDQVNSVLTRPLNRDDIEGVYAGLRPLVTGDASSTTKLSREHVVAEPIPGLIVVAGGKYTTYRVMAKDAVDAAVANLGTHIPASCTAHVPLAGASGFRAMWNARARLANDYSLNVPTLDRLLRRYGSLVSDILRMIATDPSLGKPLESGGGYLRAEVVYAATHEGALHLEDVLTRRTHIAVETTHRGVRCADEVAGLIAEPLGWNADRLQREVETYAARVKAELNSQHQPDDQSASASRLAAQEIAADLSTR